MFRPGDLVRIPKKETKYRDTLRGFDERILIENVPHEVIEVPNHGYITVRCINYTDIRCNWTLGSEYVTLWKSLESKLPSWF